MRSSRRTSAALAALGVLAALALAAWLGRHSRLSTSAFAGTAQAATDTAWDNLFQYYGNTSGTWSGGDGAQSLLLPDGSTVWFFADSYLGQVGLGAIRSAASTATAHNSAVLYRGGTLGPTYAAQPGGFGYAGGSDYTWVTPPPPYPSSRYELINGDQVIDGGVVYKFYQLADRDIHPGGFAYKLVGTVIEAFTLGPDDSLSPAGGTPLGVQDSPGSDPVIWGAALLRAGGYLYIYGVQPNHGGASRYPVYLARVPAGGLAAGDAWQYYAGSPGCSPPASAWTGDVNEAKALLDGASAGFSVTDVNGTDVLLSNDNSGASTPNNAVAYYARCPTGFAPASPRYLVYEPPLPVGYLAYEYRIVPQFSSGATVLVSYSENTTAPGSNLTNASIYRPRFLDVRLPGIGGHAGHVTDPP